MPLTAAASFTINSSRLTLASRSLVTMASGTVVIPAGNGKVDAEATVPTKVAQTRVRVRQRDFTDGALAERRERTVDAARRTEHVHRYAASLQNPFQFRDQTAAAMRSDPQAPTGARCARHANHVSGQPDAPAGQR